MSYGSNVLAAYPSSYGQSSNDRTTRSSFDNVYQSDVPYRNSDRVINEDLAYNQNNYDTTTTYRRPLHSNSNSSSLIPTTDSRKPIPPNRSADTSNDITEYADSLATGSSVARSINHNSANKFSNSQQHHNLLSNNLADNSQLQTTKQSDEIKTKSPLKNPKKPTRAQPLKTLHEKSLTDELIANVASYQSPQSSSINIEAWLNDTTKKSPVNENAPKQAWPDQIQHEKQNGKTSRSSQTNESKPIGNKTKPKTNSIARGATYEIQQDPHFDSLVDDVRNSTFHPPTSTKAHLLKKSFHNSSKRVPPPIASTSWKKQEQIQYPIEEIDPDHSQSELTHRDSIHKDPDERFREALQKLRTDRAKQQKELSETTTKRLQYGDYVRNSIKDGLLQDVVKPSSWSDFMELKKGNLYSLSKEQRKQLHDQSIAYAERIRNRNFDMRHEGETARSLQQNALRKDDIQQLESSNLTPRQVINNGDSKSVSRTSKQVDSESKLKITNKAQAKQKDLRDVYQMKINQHSRTNAGNHRSNTYVLSNGEYENTTDYNPKNKFNQQQKKKTVRYAKYDSTGREINGIEEIANELSDHSKCPVCFKPRKMNNNLYTLHEERSFEDVRYKKQ